MTEEDFESLHLVQHGLIGQIDEAILGNWGDQWTPNVSDFLDAERPTSVHPSLWLQAQRNRVHGLFELAPGFYQARGYDISNISFIAGDKGWIVVDPLTNPFTARACLDLVNRTVGERPVTAIIYTHSHADHFGGATGLATVEQVQVGEVAIIAPADMIDEWVDETLLGGPTMMRRGTYQFGSQLPHGAEGFVDAGLGPIFSLGPLGVLMPSLGITEPVQDEVIDGVPITFVLTPETEAESEMVFYLPTYKALCTAEICTGTIHNLIPIRGAAARDSLAWSKYINIMLDRFGGEAEFTFPSHNWPIMGNEQVREYLVLQRDLYRWMHDQSLRLANSGRTIHEIPDELELPPEFQAHPHTRGYYGSLAHNLRAVYQRYFSWYDGNPAHLNPLPPAKVGKRYVEFMGGADALLSQAQRSFDEGDFRWVVEVVNHVVFSDPSNQRARTMQADALEQLGFGCESATYRNAYLTGAYELRLGSAHLETLTKGRSVNDHAIRSLLSAEQIFDFMGVRLRAESVGGMRITIAWHFEDLGSAWRVDLSNRALSSSSHLRGDEAAKVTSTRTALMDFISGSISLDEALSGVLKVEGDLGAVRTILENITRFEPGYAVVEP
jgi:alkyl sulfatase BDS1-like metallo-beta-lactamase superfamily hydrolase